MKWFEITANLIVEKTGETDESCGYRFELPLDENMQLVANHWKKGPRPYKVTRFWSDEPDLEGQLVLHMRNSWLINYTYPMSPDPTVQLGEERMTVGEFLSIRDHASDMHTFKITSIEEVRWFPTAAENSAV